jgi:hypothetical protein
MAPPSGSLSLARASIVTAAPATVVARSARASGGAFGNVTATVTLAVLIAPAPSPTVQVKLSMPSKPAWGV